MSIKGKCVYLCSSFFLISELLLFFLWQTLYPLLGRWWLWTCQGCYIWWLPATANSQGKCETSYNFIQQKTTSYKYSLTFIRFLRCAWTLSKCIICEFYLYILQTEAELLAEKRCVAHLTGEVNITFIYIYHHTCSKFFLLIFMILTDIWTYIYSGNCCLWSTWWYHAPRGNVM